VRLPEPTLLVADLMVGGGCMRQKLRPPAHEAGRRHHGRRRLPLNSLWPGAVGPKAGTSTERRVPRYLLRLRGHGAAARTEQSGKRSRTSTAQGEGNVMTVLRCGGAAARRVSFRDSSGRVFPAVGSKPGSSFGRSSLTWHLCSHSLLYLGQFVSLFSREQLAHSRGLGAWEGISVKSSG